MQNRLLILSLFVFLLIGRSAFCQRTPPPVLTIEVRADGLSPEEVESLVTVPLEVAIQGLPGLRQVRSVSSRGKAVIRVELARDVDPLKTRQLLQQRLAKAASQLPRGVSVPTLTAEALGTPLLMVALRSTGDRTKGADDRLAELRIEAEYWIRPRLRRVPGVSQVAIVGGAHYRGCVVIDPVRAARYSLTMPTVEDALKKATGGLGQPGGRRPLNLDQVGKTVVAVRNGTPVRVSDLATVELQPDDQRQEAAVYTRQGDGGQGGPGLLLAFQGRPGGVQTHWITSVEKALPELREWLPKGVALESAVFTRDDLAVHIRGLPASKRENLSRIERTITASLFEVPEVAAVWWGSSPRLTLQTGDESFTLHIRLEDPRGKEKPRRSRDRILAQIRACLSREPGLSMALGRPGDSVESAFMTAEITVKLLGTDLNKLQKAAQTARKRLSKLAGVVDLWSEPPGAGPTLHLETQSDKLEKYGISPFDLFRAIRDATGPGEVGKITENDRTYGLFLKWGTDRGREAEKVMNFPLALPSEKTILLKEILTAKVVKGPSAILRQRSQRCVLITGNVQGRKPADVLAEIRKAVAPLTKGRGAVRVEVEHHEHARP
jgi:Cu/Ag efflux pump CusA